jgi:hypothetical protein
VNQLKKLKQTEILPSLKSDESTLKSAHGATMPKVQVQATSDKCRVNTTAPSLKKPFAGAFVGYAMLMEFEKDHQTLRKHWFEIKDKRNVRFPEPNDNVIATPTDNVSSCLRDGPFHSGDADSSQPVALIQSGQIAKIGGDVLISTDSNGLQYAVAPISEIVGENLPKIYRLFKPKIIVGEESGYVRVGVIDKEIKGFVRYKDSNFDNKTKTSAIFPAPKDRLVATQEVQLRDGYRLDAKIKGTIKKGQKVEVVGDTILTDGIFVWTPISTIYSTTP